MTTHVELEGVLELRQCHPVVKNRDILPLLHRGRGLLNDNNNNHDNDKPSVILSVDHTFPTSTKACPIILNTAGAKIAILISSSHELLALTLDKFDMFYWIQSERRLIGYCNFISDAIHSRWQYLSPGPAPAPSLPTRGRRLGSGSGPLGQSWRWKPWNADRLLVPVVRRWNVDGAQ